MKIETFLRRLKKTDKWRVTRNGRIRRGRSPKWDCPITAVARAKTGQRYCSGRQVREAARALGLSDGLVDSIVDAADDGLFLPGAERLRRRLLRATGLSERT